MPTLQKLKAENEQRKKDAVTHISAEEATQRTGYGSDGAKISEQRKKEDESMKMNKKGSGGLFASVCVVM
jgi:hypothetical protein